MYILKKSGDYWLTLIAVLLTTETPALSATAPYPHSPLIEGITWHADTHRTDAGGSDLWPTTWTADGHIYTSWGDGAGFGSDFPEEGGPNRVSLGFARIEGFPPNNWLGVNINGGKQAENAASFPKKGKCGGLLSVNGTLYAWLNLQDGTWPGVNQALAWSTDKAATWTQAPWVWPRGRGNFKAQTFLQSGRDYKGPRDDYIYVYGRNQTDWGQGKHGYLARVPRGRIRGRNAYTFFTGIDAAGHAGWDADIDRRRPHFTDPAGVESINVVYNEILNRYILTCHRGDQGTLGIFDGLEPWGPWTTVAYYDNWLGLKGTGKGRDMLYISIPAKWISPDGLTLWFIYTGGLDSFNMVQGTLKLKEKIPHQNPTAIPGWVDFPGTDWKTTTPRQAGLDAQEFNSWLKSQKPRFKRAYAGQKPASGAVVLTQGGRILHIWGDPDFRYQSASLGKTFTRMALQLAVDKGLIKSPTDLVKDYWTGEDQLAPHKVMMVGHNAEVRFLDLQNMTAGFPVSNGWFWQTRDATGMIGPKTIPSWAEFTGDPDYDNYAHVSPGTTSRYSSGGYWRLSQALTAVWKKDLKDVLDKHIMSKIGIPPERWDWLYGQDIRKNRNFYPQMPDYGVYIDSPYDIDGVDAEKDKYEENASTMFFWNEHMHLFSYCDFVQCRKNYQDAKDNYVYLYCKITEPEPSIYVARVPRGHKNIVNKSKYEYFRGYDSNGSPIWTLDITQIEKVMSFPRGYYHSAFLPSVVYNKRLDLFLMVVGARPQDRFSGKLPILRMYWLDSPAGPWTEFYRDDNWRADSQENIPYQPKFISKFTSADGRIMYMNYSDCSNRWKRHYVWNQQKLTLKLKTASDWRDK